MKKLLAIGAFLLLGQVATAQTKSPLDSLPDPSRQLIQAEASCGECQFKLPGKGCTLAVRYNGKAYVVDGTGIDDHGDAHSDEGFCNFVRPAHIQGEIKNGRFVASYFRLLPPLRAKE